MYVENGYGFCNSNFKHNCMRNAEVIKLGRAIGNSS